MVLDITVTTLLFGGGAVPGQVDKFDPFRVPSIRGHLRFWWRATRGGAFESVAKLREREGLIWGDTSGASRVHLRVLSSSLGPEVSIKSGSGPGYVLFPLTQAKDQSVKTLPNGGQFKLQVCVLAKTDEDVTADVAAALWAWINFGGIGGRTRRGCGALYCPGWSYSSPQPEWLSGGGQTRAWPVLGGATRLVGPAEAISKCWQTAIEALRMFRQKRTGQNGRGRSEWPEPDEIRVARQRHAPNHAPVKQGGGFPRAALGLPIIFHFKDYADPADNTLNVASEKGGGGKEEMRMASPLIVKPWAISPSQAVPLLLALNTQPLEEQLETAKAKLCLLESGSEAKRVSPPGRAAIYELIKQMEQRWGTQAQKL